MTTAEAATAQKAPAEALRHDMTAEALRYMTAEAAAVQKAPAEALRHMTAEAAAAAQAPPAEAFEVQSSCCSTQSSRRTTEESQASKGELRPSATLLFLLSTVSLVEGVDDAMLPAVAYAMQVDLLLPLSAITSMALMQALTMAVFAPLWGILADRGVMERKSLLVLGAIFQGLVTVALAFVSDYPVMLALRALNGVMLASLKPIAVSLLSEVTPETDRGKSFAWVQVSTLSGMMVGFAVGTPVSRMQFMGVDGWRVSFIGIGAISVLVGALVYALMVEPSRHRSVTTGKASSLAAACFQEIKKLMHYFTLPSFLILIVQGCAGAVAFKALSYQTLYFQVADLSDFQAGAIQSAFFIAGVFGSLLGGKVGDSFAARWPSHGRAFTAQISVGSGIPVAALLFMVPPPAQGAFFWYAFLLTCLGLFATWCTVAVNWPVLTQIVVPESRGAVVAWEAAFEGAFASVVGNLAVSFFAETLLGFDLEKQAEQAGEGSSNMAALGFALAVTSVVPLVMCLAFYSLLHWSLPRDLRRMRMRQEVAASAELGAVKEEAIVPVSV